MVSFRGRRSLERCPRFRVGSRPSRQRLGYPEGGRRPSLTADSSRSWRTTCGRHLIADNRLVTDRPRDSEFDQRNDRGCVSCDAVRNHSLCQPMSDDERLSDRLCVSRTVSPRPQSTGLERHPSADRNTRSPAVRDAADRRRHRSTLEGVEPWPRNRGPPKRQVCSDSSTISLFR